MSTNKERGQQALSSLEKELKARDRKQKRGPWIVASTAAVIILALAGGIFYLATRPGDETVLAETETAAEETPEVPEAQVLSMERAEALPATVTCSYEETGEESNGATPPPTEDISTEGTVTINLSTNQGEIGVELDRTVAPCTVNAIEHLVDEGYYDETVCHRLTTSGIYVLQCGDPTGTGAGGPGFEFANEYPTDESEGNSDPVIYPRGSIAMANAGVGTNGSQFFLNYDDSTLAADYTYFGQISEEGLATLDAIAETGVEGGLADGAPAEEVLIEAASVS